MTCELFNRLHYKYSYASHKRKTGVMCPTHANSSQRGIWLTPLPETSHPGAAYLQTDSLQPHNYNYINSLYENGAGFFKTYLQWQNSVERSSIPVFIVAYIFMTENKIVF